MRACSFLAIFLLIFSIGSSFSADAQTEEVSGANRKVVNRVVPQTPPLARQMSLHGSVKLEVSVAGNGTVKSVQVKGGNPVLAQAAENAVRSWRWERSDRETTEPVQIDFNQ